MGTERANLLFERAQRPSVSLSDDFLVQLTSFMTSLVPSLTEVRKIGIKNRMGARPTARGRSCFLFKYPIDTARTDPNELSNLFFVVPLSIELPDPFMDGYPLAMTSTTFLFLDLWHCSSGSWACFA